VKLVVNGAVREIVRAGNIAELIDELGLPSPVTLVEYNGLALRQDEWPQQTLAEGDRVELMRIAAGG
jgi:sulfur carrier protein